MVKNIKFSSGNVKWHLTTLRVLYKIIFYLISDPDTPMIYKQGCFAKHNPQFISLIEQ